MPSSFPPQSSTAGPLAQEPNPFYNMLMQAPVAMAVMFGPDYVFEMVNERALLLWGKHLNDILDQPVFAVFPELDGQGFDKILKTVYTSGQPYAANERQVTIDIQGKREELCINFTYQPVKNTVGEVDRILLFMVDVTEQVNARRKVEESEQQLSSMASAMPQLVWIADPGGKVLYYNDRIAEFAGVKKLANNMWHWEGMLHEDDLGPTIEAWQTALQTEKEYEVTHRILMKDGTYRWYLSRGVPYRNTKGQVDCWYGTATNIHSQKEAEEKLEFLAALSQSVADAVVGTDTRMHITSWNKGAEKMYGWLSSEVTGKPISEILQTTYLSPENEKSAYDTLVKQSYWQGEVVQNKKSGEPMNVLASIAFVYDSTGKNIGAVGVNRDVSEQKAIEQTLRKNKEQLEITFQNAPTAIFHFNKQGKLIYLNKKGCEILGNAEASEILSTRDMYEFREKVEGRYLLYDVYGVPLPVTRTSVYLAMASLKYEEVLTNFVERSTGKQSWYLAGSQPLLDSSGQLMLILTTWTDITLQKESEKAIRQSEKNFRQLANLIPQIVFTATPDGVPTYFNEQWFNYTGSSAKNQADPWLEVLHPEDVKEHVEKWATSMKTGEPYRIEYRFRDRRTGTYRWFLGKAVPVKDEDGNITKWFGTCTDIDDQKQFAGKLEAVVVQRTRELKRSNDDLLQFAHVASHDLKEPARKVRTFGTRLLNEFSGQLPEKALLYVNKMEGAAKRMSMMIEGVLKYSTVNEMNSIMQPVDLNDVLANIENDLELMIKQKSAAIRYSNLPRVNGAPELIYQLFYNITYNALKFSKEDEAPLIQITVLQLSQQFVKIAIADNGIGFEAQHAQKIFETFTRLNAKDKFEGTGLGLALCKRIIERHGGEIQAAGTPGVGATFTLTLPLPLATDEGVYLAEF